MNDSAGSPAAPGAGAQDPAPPTPAPPGSEPAPPAANPSGVPDEPDDPAVGGIVWTEDGYRPL